MSQSAHMSHSVIAYLFESFYKESPYLLYPYLKILHLISIKIAIGCTRIPLQKLITLVVNLRREVRNLILNIPTLTLCNNLLCKLCHPAQKLGILLLAQICIDSVYGSKANTLLI